MFGKRIIKIKQKDNFDKVKFSWEMFYNCNYNCSYCFEKNLDKKNNIIDIKKLIHHSILIKKILFSKKLDNQMKTLTILGGEPSILSIDNFKKIFTVFKNQNNIEFEYFTNFSNSAEYYFKIGSFFNQKIKFFLSFHYEFTNCNEYLKKIENFLNLIKNENLNNIRLCINLLINDNTKNFIKKFYYAYIYLHNKYGDIISLRITEELISKNMKVIKAYNYQKFLKNNKYLETFFENNYIKEITFSNNKIINDYEPKNFSPFGYKCYVKHLRLNPFGKLTTVCCNNIISEEIEKFNIEELPEYFLCKQKKCYGAYRSLEVNK